MDDQLLSKDALSILKNLCRQYKRRKKLGALESDAKDFGSSLSIQNELFPDRSFADIDAGCRELFRAGFLSGLIADAHVYSAFLTDAGIAFNEKAFSRNATTIFGFVKGLFLELLSHLPG